MPSAEINLNWNETTVEQFAMYKIERMRTNDTLWTPIVDLSDPFQLSYTDTIFDDENLIYRIGIFDVEDNVLWATESISIPKTKSVLIPNEFRTIQPAFDSELIDDGDTIRVNPGIYIETLSIAGKDVLIKSTDNFLNTTLMPTFTENYALKKRVVSISIGTLDGFSIELGEPAYGAPGGGVAISNIGTVQNCFITQNKSEGYGGGVFITDYGNLYNSIINGDTASIATGLYISSAHGEIINNTIAYNSLAGDDVVINGNCEGLIFRNNIVTNPSWDVNLRFLNQADTLGVMLDYLLLDNYTGFGDDIIIADPGFDDLTYFTLSPVSPCIDAGHPDDKYLDIDGSRNDIGATGGHRAR